VKSFFASVMVLAACSAWATSDDPETKLLPTCAGCAGEARSLSGGKLMGDWTFASRWIGTSQQDARWRASLDRSVTPRLNLGLEWNPISNELQPRGTWFLSPETTKDPGFVLGFTADRLSTHPLCFYQICAQRPPDLFPFRCEPGTRIKIDFSGDQ
jgi:hypothetical protein